MNSHNSFPKNQNEAMIAHIRRHGEIDFLSAANFVGVSQLTARMSELRRKGWTFETNTEKGKSRFGHTSSTTMYAHARLAEAMPRS